MWTALDDEMRVFNNVCNLCFVRDVSHVSGMLNDAVLARVAVSM